MLWANCRFIAFLRLWPCNAGHLQDPSGQTNAIGRRSMAVTSCATLMEDNSPIDLHRMHGSTSKRPVEGGGACDAQPPAVHAHHRASSNTSEHFRLHSIAAAAPTPVAANYARISPFRLGRATPHPLSRSIYISPEYMRARCGRPNGGMPWCTITVLRSGFRACARVLRWSLRAAAVKSTTRRRVGLTAHS